MYNNAYSTPAFTNNPFINDPTSAQSRFPDLSSPSPSNTTQYAQWLQPAPNPTATTYLAQPTNLYQQQQQQYGSVQSGYFVSGSPQQQTPGLPFQPSGSFGQQLAANASYGYLQGQVQPQQTEYSPVQQQLQSSTYIAQFDPYASIGQGWDGHGQSQSQQAPSAASGYSTSPSSTSPSGDLHPRDYIRNHKLELEAWDSYAWKQLLNSFDALKSSWDGRTNDLGLQVAQLQQQMGYSRGGYYSGQIQQEGVRLHGLLKEAQSNFDSVAASSFQMHEVFQGYRQSGDLASKRRVREASNAALQNLPDWPTNVY